LAQAPSSSLRFMPWRSCQVSVVMCDYTPHTNAVACDYTLTHSLTRHAAMLAIAAALTACTSHSSATRSVQTSLALATRSFDVMLSVSETQWCLLLQLITSSVAFVTTAEDAMSQAPSSKS
jgi:hypothetical protein